MKRALTALSLCVGILALVGCEIKQIPTQHIIMINSNGDPVDPTGNVFCNRQPDQLKLCNGRHLPLWFIDYDEFLRNEKTDQFRTYLDRLFDELRKHPKAQDGKRKILIFVHGGLNGQKRSLERATKLSDLIRKESDYYPIFVNWDSSFYSSYYEHLIRIRQGRRVAWWNPLGYPLSPVYFVIDIARGVVGAPVLWSFELTKIELEEGPRKFQKKLKNEYDIDVKFPFIQPFIDSSFEAHYEQVSEDLKKAYAAYRAKHGTPTGPTPREGVVRVSEGNENRSWSDTILSGLSWVGTLPTKIVLAPIVDALGESAWNNMLRRTRMLYHTEEEFTEQATGPYSHPAGALSVFMSRLYQEIWRDDKTKWEITLVGHSMGTIILNEMIRHFGVILVKDQSGVYQEYVMPFNRIVYMGAACTIRDYEDSVFPYLKKHGDAQFFHLTLHEEAEERERQDIGIPNTDLELPYVDPVMRGSLLIWIDDFLSNPETFLDKPLGSYANLMLTVHDTPNSIRDQIHIKAFPVGSAVAAPQKHGDFSRKFKFWREDCWRPSDAGQPDCYDEKGYDDK